MDWHHALVGRAQGVPIQVLSFTRTTTQMSTSATDATIGGHPRREDDIALFARFVRHVLAVILASECCRLVTDGLKNTVIELRKDEETRMSV